MAEDPRVLAPDNADFDAFYRGESPIEGLDLQFDRVPWDIGEPQPALVELERSGGFRGHVLDSGCGLGENALFLAERGYRVTGVDGAQNAIDGARQRAADRGVDTEFVVGDMTSLDGFEQRYDTVLDSALYHCLGDDQRHQYSAALHRVTRPGGQLHLFCFADEAPSAFPAPFAVSQQDLRAHLGEHWAISEIELTNYASAFTSDSMRRMAAEHDLAKFGLDFNPDGMQVDDQGRVLLPVWYLHAERR